METNYQYIDTAKNPIYAWVKGVPLEDEAKQQLLNVASLPFIFKHVAVMPDAHWGMGATVGSVIATKGAVIPAAAGVDLGCGMNAIRLSLKAKDLPDNLNGIFHQIERDIPLGAGAGHGRPSSVYTQPILESSYSILASPNAAVLKAVPEALKKAVPQLGSLGSGNHFIELCLDENQDVWVMLHSGSRGIGNMIGKFYIELAKKEMEKWMIHLPDRNLAYLPEGSEHFEDYINAVSWAQDYALLNRKTMMQIVLGDLSRLIPVPFTVTQEAINCHHNYISRENHFGDNVWVTRKGAVRAREGDLGIIPGSMGTKSYIVKGLGNPDSFFSCSHGAGRSMSRTEAKKRFTKEDHEQATEGVVCRKDKDVIDETPAAYKNIDAVMSAQSDLVEVVHTLKQCLCVKG